jgi:organic radical activating enzyme
MSKIKVAELFYSIQGEGRYMGVPSVFLRTFGCNFKCAGFGMPKGQLSKEVEDIAARVHYFDKYEQLPLVSTGCDSYASWDPRFKDLSPVLDSDAIVERIMEILPHGKWKDEHLVITGGEPLLGWQRAYADLLNHPRMQRLKEITFETNGTQELDPKFADYLTNWTSTQARGREALTFSVSAKLPVSGESWDEAIRPEIVMSYAAIGHTYLKFVVETDEHIHDAIRATDEFRAAGFKGPIYLMPQGGVVEPYDANKLRIANICCEQGWNYSPRLHVDLWGNGWGK